MTDQSQRVLELVRKARVLRPRDLHAHGIPRIYLGRLTKAGKLTRISRGLYALPEADVTEHQTLIEASKKLPNGVICLLSALRFHDLTTASPYEVCMAIGEKDWKPRFTYPPVRLFRFSEVTLSAGVNEHIVDNCSIRVFRQQKLSPIASSIGTKWGSTWHLKHCESVGEKTERLQMNFGISPISVA